MSGGKTHWVFWPFLALWNLVSLLLGLTGRIIAFALGLALLLLGVVLMLTILAAPLGVILVVIGFLLIIRSLF